MVSSGETTGTDERLLEMQQFQLLTEASPARSSLVASLFGRTVMQTGDGFVRVRLSKPIPTQARGYLRDVGYVEVWDNFRIRKAYHHGQTWTVASFAGFQASESVTRSRRAAVMLTDVLLPRSAVVRSLRAPVTSLPFVWCFVRHRALYPVGDQSIVVHRLVDNDSSIPGPLQPPKWTGTQCRGRRWFRP